MSERIPDSVRLRIEAYHDEELSRFGRWRFERAMRRDPELRVELHHLRNQRLALQNQLQTEAFDIWDEIEERLPPAAPAPVVEEAPGWDWGLGRFGWPGAAVAATAVVAAVFAFGGAEPEAPPGGIVSWIDTGGHDVMLLQGAPDTTIIWVVGGPTTQTPTGGTR
ncbi:MAG: hypothetical protein AAF430_10600 [Myxococcota bacterium]